MVDVVVYLLAFLRHQRLLNTIHYPPTRFPMIVLFRIVTIVAAIMVGACLRDIVDVDSCLDSGRVFDYMQRVCRQDSEISSLPFVPRLTDRFSTLAVVAIVILLGIAGEREIRKAENKSRDVQAGPRDE